MCSALTSTFSVQIYLYLLLYTPEDLHASSLQSDLHVSPTTARSNLPKTSLNFSCHSSQTGSPYVLRHNTQTPTSLYPDPPMRRTPKCWALRKREVCCVGPSGVPDEDLQKKWVRLLLSSPEPTTGPPSPSFGTAIITPVSLTHQHLGSFTANQVQLMIISCSVSPHPRQAPACALVGGTRANHGAGGHSGVHCTRWPCSGPFFALTGPFSRLRGGGLINTGHSLERGRPSLCHTLDRRGLSQHNRLGLPPIIRTNLDCVDQ